MAKNVTGACRRCNALCCRYIALPIETPDTKGEFDDIRWYLAHRNVEVFVEDGDWYILFKTRCKYLTQDNLCKIYDHRPRICRKYKTDNCELTGDDYQYEQHFKRPEDIEAYARKFLREKYSRARRGKRRKAR